MGYTFTLLFLFESKTASLDIEPKNYTIYKEYHTEIQN